ncbi:hypothetical protein [Komagataeibacter europaeus]|uniref:hypothetical protein n=1 Tax=Komagataeibacter europaeus TaxID=33995 RepID=UPI0015FB3A7B|nr:hypothetical protein [Komagataeibacter europaeus]
MHHDHDYPLHDPVDVKTVQVKGLKDFVFRISLEEKVHPVRVDAGIVCLFPHTRRGMALAMPVLLTGMANNKSFQVLPFQAGGVLAALLYD